ncbi:hypothetical protein [Nonomuraea gerenzanensis]|uniref:Aminoglycoside phosphotransferase domain-containing protein n=1 Tax=Nonomuraea gerenzanensis TaxID=93944 RepID=A0A1M4BLE0_9ACTN|nr:hypothetical protein [Nonomuraea gerenzanensis]UBU19218.1 hypothetical protein LCN96_56205 [Nonomuraea gerenzanensis]SAP16382.1 hypothetical protein BN4615_P11045 [Nonomuraea gerenzanensis]
MTTTLTPLHEFGTASVHTSIYRNGAEYTWVRRPGAAYPVPLPALSADLRALLGSVHPALRLPDVDGSMYYSADGTLPAASWLAFDEDLVRPMLQDALRQAGAALAALHALPPPGEVRRRHPGPARLAAWLRGRCESPASGRLREHALARLGGSRWERLQAICADLGAAPAGSLLHGAASMALIVPVKGGGGNLLAGEDLSRGPWWLDLGWLVAELVELHQAVLAGIAPALEFSYRGLAAALLDGYGRVPDVDRLGALAVLRVLTHARDYAAYIGWDDQLHRYVDIVAGLFDQRLGTEAARAIVWPAAPESDG